MSHEIRPVGIADSRAVAQLSAELGYPVDVATMEERIRSLAGSPDRATYAACSDGAVVAWIDVFEAHHLQSGASAEIGGLVVSEAHRNAGVGALLLLRAEQWARERGLANMIVRSRITREAAHRFYLRHGYGQTKTSAIFAKKLA